MIKKKIACSKCFQEGWWLLCKRTYVFFCDVKIHIHTNVRQWKSVSSLVGTLHDYNVYKMYECSKGWKCIRIHNTHSSSSIKTNFFFILIQNVQHKTYVYWAVHFESNKIASISYVFLIKIKDKQGNWCSIMYRKNWYKIYCCIYSCAFAIS